MARTRNKKYLWFFDRAGNVAEIIRGWNGEPEATMNLADPTPGLAGEAPDGKFPYVSLRGPNPLSGDPHASTAPRRA